jgi:TRAP-type C4-dicarboxylate transport system permease large subunit
MNTSYLLLAIPLFILAAEFMNSGSIMDGSCASATRWSGASAGASPR